MKGQQIATPKHTSTEVELVFSSHEATLAWFVQNKKGRRGCTAKEE